MKPSAGHFHPLQVLLFPTHFSPHFGEKTFWWVRGENTHAHQFPPPPPSLQLNTHQKCFLSHFLSSYFILFYYFIIFIFLFSLKNPLHQTYPKGHLGKNLSLTSYKGFQTQLSHIPPITRKLTQVFTFFPLFSFVKIYLFLLS